MNGLANLEKRQGQLAEAERGFREVLGATHANTLASMTSLAEVLIEEGLYEDAAADGGPLRAAARPGCSRTAYFAGGFGAGILGEARPAPQFQAMPPLALLRATTVSWNSYIPGNRWSEGCGASVNAM